MKIVIVGGVAGGATAAARARRLDEAAEIVMFERGHEVSFANCGLPYHIGGEIPQRAALLVQTRAGLAARFRLDIRTRTEVEHIDAAGQRVRVRDLESGRTYEESYDRLLLSPGAAPLRPPIPGVEHPAIHTLRNMADMDRIKGSVDAGAQRALVVGGGFIGLEMAENLRRRGLEVALVELLPQVMPPFDPEVAARLHQELAANDVQLYLEDGVTAFEDAEGGVRATLRSGARLEVDLVVLAVGVRPDTGLARAAGLKLSERGALLVDEVMRTSDPYIFAVGDAVQVEDAVLGGPAYLPLAGPANRQARIAVDAMLGRASRYRGAQGTSIVQLFDVTAGITGASEKVLRQRGVPYQKVYVQRAHHVTYYPGAQSMMIKLLFAPEDGRLLGAQLVGGAGVDKRLDVLAAALAAGLTVHDLEDLELAYAPQFGAAKDPVNIAGNVAVNALRGEEEFVDPAVLDAAGRAAYTLLDVREQVEFEAGHIPGARWVPLATLRARLGELPSAKPLAVYCGVGQRAYYATRILRAHGLRACNVAGGFALWTLIHAPRPRPRPLHRRPLSALTASTSPSGVASEESGCCVGPATNVNNSAVAVMTRAVERTEPHTSIATGSPGQIELDLRGLQCPGPLAALAAAARAAAPGALLRARADDLGFCGDVEAWCARSGHKLESTHRDGREFVAEIRLHTGADVAPAGSPAAANSTRKTFVVFSSDLDRVMAALVIANAAADMGDEVTLFFTFWGLNALRKEAPPPTKKALLDRMFGWMMPRGAQRLVLSKMHMGGMGTAMMRHVMRKKGVADLPTLLASAQQKGVRLIACSMSMEVMGLQREELIDGLEIAGAARYVNEASQSGVNLFI